MSEQRIASNVFEPPPSQLQSVGDLIGRAARAYRNNIPLFFHVLLWPTIFATAARVVMQWGLTRGLKEHHGDFTRLGIAIACIVVGILAVMAAGWILTLRQLAFVRMINGFSASYREAIEFINQRQWRTMGAFIVAYAIGVVACFVWGFLMAISAVFLKGGSVFTIASLLGMTISVVGFVATMVIFMVVGFVICGVLACEDTGIGNSLTRAFSLSFKDIWRSLLFGILLMVTITLLSYPLTLPMVLLSLFEFFRQGMAADVLTDPYKLPFYCLVIDQVWEALVSLALWPLMFLSIGLFYYDLRMRKEALDIVQRLGQLGHLRA